MRLVDFLICLLEAHAQTQQRLAAFFGEERLLQMLEEAGEREVAQSPPLYLSFPVGASPGGSQSSAYAELEAAVQDFGLPAVLTFHLWAYPTYRELIESPLDLQSQIARPSPDANSRLIDETIRRAEAWMKSLTIPPSVAPQAERAAQIPWIKFRTQVMRRMGLRPLEKI